MAAPICKLPYIGPSIESVERERNYSTKRDLYTHESNLTPSMDNHVVNPLFRSSEKLLTRTPKGPIKQIISAAAYTVLKAPTEQTKLFKEQIALAAQNRVAAFYQQLVVTYQTHLHFAVGKTFDQGAAALTCQLINGKKAPITMKMDGSHTSTLPCLYAYPRQADGTPDLNQGFVYLKESDAYRFWNTTIDLPKHFNLGVDAKLDRNLRDQAIEILNENAQGTTRPEPALFSFLNQFFGLIHSHIQQCQRQLKSRPAEALELQAQIEGLKLYQTELLKIENALINDPKSFDAYLNVQVNPQDTAFSIRRAVYQIRYEAIQTNSSRQSELIAKIDAVKRRIMPSGLQYADEAFKELLVETCVDSSDQKRIAKLYNLPRELRANTDRRSRIEASKRKILAQRITNSKGQVYTGEQYLRNLAIRVHNHMLSMRNQEAIDRGVTLRKLRWMRNYTQKELARKIKQYFPLTPASQPTISRSETGERTVTVQYAKQLSCVLKVDPILFMPQFFNE